MKAVLLAGGIGSRISEIKVPKCTLQVNGKSIVSQTVQMLLNNEVKVAVVTGYKGKIVEEELSGLDVTFYHNPFFRVTNSIASLWFARGFFDDCEENLIVANADVLWDQYIFDKLVESVHERTMISDSSRVKQGVGDFFFSLNGSYVTGYGKELAISERDTEYVGVAKIMKSTLPAYIGKMADLINQENYNMWWENVLYEDLESHPIYSLDIDGHNWGEVDSIEDFQRLQTIMKN